METVKITKEKLNLFVWAGKTYVTNNPRQSKIWYAIQKVLPQAIKKLKAFANEKEQHEATFAKKDGDKFIENDQWGRKKFDEEGNKKLTIKLQEIEQEIVQIPCHIIPLEDVNEKLLTYDTRSAFEGIVIPTVDYENMDIDSLFNEKKVTAPVQDDN